MSCQSSKKLPKPTAGHGKREVGGLTLTQSIATTHKHEAVVRLYDAKAGYVECSLPKAQDKSFSGSLIVLEVVLLGTTHSFYLLMMTWWQASECCGPLLSVVIKYLFACWLVHPMVLCALFLQCSLHFLGSIFHSRIFIGNYRLPSLRSQFASLCYRFGGHEVHLQVFSNAGINMKCNLTRRQGVRTFSWLLLPVLSRQILLVA